jgi:phosphate butyryltransferase
MQIATFHDMVAMARRVGPVTVAVAAAHDPEVLKAVDQAQREGMIRATLVGEWPAIEAYAAQTGVDLTGMVLVHEPDPQRAAQQVVGLARDGAASVVVKGQCKTADLLAAALNRHLGIRALGLFTHVALFELPGMDRLITERLGVVLYPDVYRSSRSSIRWPWRSLGVAAPGSDFGCE